MSRLKYVEILGASSLVAPYLTRRLVEGGHQGACMSRTPPQAETHCESPFSWAMLDASSPGKWLSREGGVLISFLPIWLVPPLLPRLNGCQQLIVFSTTSVLSKKESADSKERDLAKRIWRAEEEIEGFCSSAGLNLTIIRPTLIYDCLQDANITSIAQFIRRWQVFPIAAPGNGLRQPVHADDLAMATAAAIDNPKAYNREFNLGGGETLTYREMVRRIFSTLGKQPVFIPIPVKLAIAGCKLLQRTRKSTYSPEMFRRMNQDLVFDSAAAHEALGYSPRPFRPTFP